MKNRIKRLINSFILNSETTKILRSKIHDLEIRCFKLEAKNKGYDINLEQKTITTYKELNLVTHRELQDLFDNKNLILWQTPTARYTDEIIKMANGWVLIRPI